MTSLDFEPDKMRRRLTAAIALGSMAAVWRGAAAQAIPIDVWPAWAAVAAPTG